MYLASPFQYQLKYIGPFWAHRPGIRIEDLVVCLNPGSLGVQHCLLRQKSGWGFSWKHWLPTVRGQTIRLMWAVSKADIDTWFIASFFDTGLRPIWEEHKKPSTNWARSYWNKRSWAPNLPLQNIYTWIRTHKLIGISVWYMGRLTLLQDDAYNVWWTGNNCCLEKKWL